VQRKFSEKQEAIEKLALELRTLESQVRAANRELAPLNKDKQIYLRNERGVKLRTEIRRRRHAVVKIQKIWRGKIIRLAYNDNARDYWTECTDEDQSEYPFFYNTWTQETSWMKPLAFKYFCDPAIG